MATVSKETKTTATKPEIELYGWDDMREIKLPRAPKGEPNYVFVGVNGVNKQVPRGQTVTVPYPIYERLQIMLEAEDSMYDYREEIPNE